jgi:predicted acetyltransferase
VSGFEVRPATEDEWPGFVESDRIPFGILPAEEDLAPERRAFPLDRTVGAFEGGRVVGTAAAFEFDLTLPGLTTAPAAGVTWVGVLPTHRRKGILTAMMRHQLDEIHSRGEPLAILLASESVIYGRFGYGLATVQADYELERRHAVLARPFESPGRIRLADDDTASKVVPEVHERVRRLQHGDVSRPQGWWDAYFRGARRGGSFGPRFTALYEGPDGTVEGYAAYRVRADFATQLSSDWTVLLQSLATTSFEAYVSLWKYVWEVDLTARVITSFRPTDEPLRHLLTDPRRLVTTRATDYLWCRVVDLPAALTARRYEREGSVVLDVADPLCPWNEGRWTLTAGPDGATCERTDASPDVTLGAAELGAAYLGGTRLAVLAAARRVDEHTTGSLRLADQLFATARQPWCQTFF